MQVLTDISTNGTKIYTDIDVSGGGSGEGDMLKATYDPNEINSNAFNMDNMVEGTTKKILTTTERTKLSNLSGTNTGDETATTIKNKLEITTLSGSNTGDQDLTGKVDKVTGKGLSTEDYTTAEKTKVGHISVTQAVNLDTMESDIATNNAKVSYPSTINSISTENQGTPLNLNTGTVSINNTQYDGDIDLKFNNPASGIGKLSWKTGTMTFAFNDGTYTITLPKKTGTLIQDLVDDTTPQLGGNLDTNGKSIDTVTPTELSYVHGVTSGIQTQINGKQATLVSGTNIKTVNSTSLLGSGDIVISGGGTKCTGAEINTGTDDTKFATPKAIEDSNLIRSTNDTVTDITTCTLAEYNALTTEQKAGKTFLITDDEDTTVSTFQDITCTLASGFSAVTGDPNTLKYNPLTRQCVFFFSLSGTVSAGTHTTITTIPLAYRPSGRVYNAGTGGASGWFQILVQPDGAVLLWSPSASASPRGQITWII